MANATQALIQTLKKTAKNMSGSSAYQWGHMGACNCGFLVQEITRFSKDEIHRRAMQGHGDWNEQLNDYCPASGLLMDDMISTLLDAGFDIDDLKNLERLSSPEVLRSLPEHQRNLKHNVKADVIAYLNAWADLLDLKVRKEDSKHIAERTTPRKVLIPMEVGEV